ncbi:MAG: hypothetical protein ACM3KR_00650 [Deltaproteobacteria bacterium]
MLDENGNVVFNEQEKVEVDRLINESVNKGVGDRLSREGYYDMKEIVETLKEFDFVGTPAEVKEALKAQAEIVRANKAEAERQAVLDSLREEARNEGTSPELLAEIKSLKTEIASIKQKEQEAQMIIENQRIANEKWQSQENEFIEKYPNVDLAKLDNDEKFIKFVKRSSPALTLVEKYEDYMELVGGAESLAMEKFKLNSERSTGSGKGAGNVGGGTYGLTAKQQALADENGISYKEYSETLKQIKRG